MEQSSAKKPRVLLDIEVMEQSIKTFIARAFKYRHLLYSAILVVIMSTLVLGGVSLNGSPEFANASASSTVAPSAVIPEDGDAASPADVRNAIPGIGPGKAIEFLTFLRWNGSSSLPSPNISIGNIGAMVSGGITMIGTVFFAIASVAMWGMGLLLAMAVNLDLLNRLSLTIDHTFAAIATDAFSTPVTIGFLFLVLLGMTAFNIMRGRIRDAFVGLGVGGLAILALIGMAAQSVKNHNDMPGGDKAPIANMAILPTGGSGVITGAGTDIKNPGNWAPFSPGWLITQTDTILTGATGIITKAINGVAEATTAGGVQVTSRGLCGAYIDTLHDTFDSVDGVANNGHMQILKSYDKLVLSVYFEPYVTAAYGNSIGASNAWCRIAEAQAGIPAGEQAYLSNEAGLYNELVGWGGSNSIVAANGSWRQVTWQGTSSIGWAGDFFGTNIYSPAAKDKMVSYFAACTWEPGQSAKANEEWKQVLSANTKFEPSLWPWENIANAIEQATGMAGYISDNMCTEVARPLSMYFGFNKNEDDSAAQFNFRDDTNSPVFGIFGSTGKHSKNFTQAVLSGNAASYDYYRTTQGSNGLMSALFGVIVVVLMFMMVKYMLPLIVGAIIAQALATMALMFLPISILLLIVPIAMTRKILGLTGLTVLLSQLVNLCFVTVATITLMMIHLLIFVFSPVGSAVVNLGAVTGISGSLINTLQVGLAVFLGLKVMRMILTKVFAIDMRSFGKAALSAGVLSGGAVLSQMGYQTPRVLNSFGDPGRGPGDALSETRSRIGRGVDLAASAADSLDGVLNDPTRGSGNEVLDRTDDMANLKTDADDISAVTGDGNFANASGVVVAPVPTGSGPNGDPAASGGTGLTEAEQAELDKQAVGQVNNLLGNAATDSQLEMINQPGNAGSLNALGVNPDQFGQAIDGNAVPSVSSEGPVSPHSTPEAARANFDAALMNGETMAAQSQLEGANPADSALARSSLFPESVGVDANGNLLDSSVAAASAAGAAAGLSAAADSGLSESGRYYNEATRQYEQYIPGDIPMIFDDSFFPGESSGSQGGSSSGPSMSTFSGDPGSTFEWDGKTYNVDDVSRSIPGLAQAVQMHEAYEQIADSVGSQSPDDRFLRRVADLGRGRGIEHSLARWFMRGR